MKQVMLSVSIICLCCVVIEILFLHDAIVVDPKVHHISYENWKWMVYEWEEPEYYDFYCSTLEPMIDGVNLLFEVVLGFFLCYIFVYSKHFMLKRVSVGIAIAIIVVAEVLLSYYFRYGVDFYRVYMYSSYNVLVSLYVIMCARRIRFN